VAAYTSPPGAAASAVTLPVATPATFDGRAKFPPSILKMPLSETEVCAP
jgi:hypothetical protein